MSDASNGGRAKGTNSETGVLANLPRTRPQRASARRTAARKAASAAAKATDTAAKAPQKASAKASASAPTPATAPAPARGAKRTGARKSPAKARPRPLEARRAAGVAGREETVPRQGFESDGEIVSGSVQPPGAAELVSSAAELAGELAKAGVTGGARLLKDIFARLPPG